MTTKGLFFGSFNPIHNGHLEIANFFLRNKYLSEIIFIVTPQNPLKLKNENLSFKKRLRAVEIATKNISKIRFSDVESKLTFPNYTSDTLKFLRAENPNIDYVFIMGSDLLINFNKWKNYQNILEHHNLFIYPRNNRNLISKEFKTHKKIRFFEAPLMNISGTIIREKIKNNESFNHLVPPPAYDFIKKSI